MWRASWRTRTPPATTWWWWVSAQGDTTDDLIAKAGEITHDPSQREMDMLLATGEQISISLLAMALGETGCPPSA